MTLALTMPPGNDLVPPKPQPTITTGLAELANVCFWRNRHGIDDSTVCLTFKVGDRQVTVAIRDDSEPTDGALSFELVRRMAWIQKRILLRFPFDGLRPHLARAEWLQTLSAVIAKGTEGGR